MCEKLAVYHDNSSQFVIRVDRNEILLKILVWKNSREIKEIRLYYRNRSSTEYQYTILSESYDDCEKYYFWGAIQAKEVLHYIKYFFKIYLQDGTIIYYSPFGTSEKKEREEFEFLYVNMDDVLKPVSWLKDSIFYQIFPDRFSKGKFLEHENVEPWGTQPTQDNFMGGDLLGIKEKGEYIKNIGANVVYLTPIFEADFNHRYATTDYFKIDKLLGDKSDFKSLVQEFHSKDIKVVLDGVFNHTGVHFFAFQDILINQQQSKYKDWYYIKEYPITIDNNCYECVGDYRWMPKLNTSNPIVQDYVLKVITYWIEQFQIDGWRLDVADEVDDVLLKRIKHLVREYQKEIAIIGETWGFGGDMLFNNKGHSIMNYVFRDIIYDFLVEKTINPKQFIDRLYRMYGMHTDLFNASLLNMLDSHDTERFLTSCKGDTSLFKLAVLLQFTLLGIPMIYYGDEIGLEGGNDPECRKCMDWNLSTDSEILLFYQTLSKIRNNFMCLRAGKIKLYYQHGLLFIERWNHDEKVLVVLNHSEESITVDDLEAENLRLQLSSHFTTNLVEPKGFKIFVKKEKDYEI